jgi:Flp pilus assembly protein TadD
MLLRCLIAGFALVSTLGAQTDPFLAPEELKAFAHHVTVNQLGVQAKLQAILSGIFMPVEKGGLGVVYDNAMTRTVPEVWRDRQANCLSMTAFFVAACRSVGLETRYAEALNTNRWRKVGTVVRFERHVVALSHTPPRDDLVADFIPTLRRRSGVYVVAVLPEPRFQSLFHSNRAVELMDAGDLEGARREAQVSLDSDAKSSIGWNIMGVVRVALGEPGPAEEAYRKALAMDARDSSAMGNLEILLRNQGRAREAGVLRQQGEELRRRDPYFNAFLAEEALGEGNFDEAQKRIQVALKILPHESEFYLLQARIKLTLGRMDEAVKDIQEARRWADPSERERYDSKLSILKGEGETRK